MTDVQVRTISGVEVVGWFPNHERQVWVEIEVDSQKFVRRVVLPQSDKVRAS